LRYLACFRALAALSRRTTFAVIFAALLNGLKPAAGAIVAHDMPVFSPVSPAVDEALVQGDWPRDVRMAPLATFLGPAQVIRDEQAVDDVVALAQQLTASLNEVSLRFAVSAVRRTRHVPFVLEDARAP
jgi:hypothetical protein